MTPGTTSAVRALTGDDVAAAADVVAACHARLVEQAPHLPRRAAEDYLGKLGWLITHGIVLGRWHDGRLTAVLGGFRFEDFRHAGPAWFSPDWANAAADPVRAFDDYRVLYRAIAPRWVDAGARIHAVAVLASAAEAIEALSLTGFGRIVLDAAAPTADVAARTRAGRGTDGVVTRRATTDDAEAIAAMEARLAEHIGASPIFFPNPRGADADWWRGWLTQPTSVAVVAENAARPVGYVKAEDPQDDVSDVVHDPSCLAINGMYADPSMRGRGVGTALVGALAEHAAADGKTLMSVDCETHNLEAYGLWTRYFTPVTWGFERRV
ncbi:GNAT family N-acetyltransferase [Actinotalea fermentans]|uniref:N-acetyltransferase domain-containing protein n=1 Tax=Actinotalea fermentans TaxID=43671 RepID=A0A511YYQ6_9CELL|nr:GNAT family N-acetyltransferase [Actinotalea fermentans]KGM15469.1 hypothetical protein N867_08210 [Actinotalea fermentans ATCC 43279 = JCM 9966 = DSM 3133]GEN80337.1 hypothetical protein AFE02nite_20710 [Actinotalea fermentans]